LPRKQTFPVIEHAFGSWFSEVVVKIVSDEFGEYNFAGASNTASSKRVKLCPTGIDVVDIPFPGVEHKTI
jgi:hypothetical protein